MNIYDESITITITITITNAGLSKVENQYYESNELKFGEIEIGNSTWRIWDWERGKACP